MSDPHVITSTRTHVNGLAIIAQEPATGPHPRWRERTAVYKGVTKALLEDGSEVWLCNGSPGKPCNHVGSSTASTVSHRNSTHNLAQPRGSYYSEDVIKRVALEVARAKRDGIRGYAAAAAEALNGARIPTKRKGRPWTAEAVSGLYNRWAKHVRVRLPAESKPATATQRAAQRVRAATAVNGRLPEPSALQAGDLAAIRTFITIAPELAKALERVASLAEQGATIPPEIAEKARKYDELQALLGKQ